MKKKKKKLKSTEQKAANTKGQASNQVDKNPRIKLKRYT